MADRAGRRRPVPAGAVVALAAAGTLVTAACFYPGYLDGDSNWQYQQGTSGEYVDMHPVVMSWLLGRLDRIVAGTGAYFLLTAALFWTGLGLVLRCFTSSRRGFAITALLIGTSLPVFSMLGQIQKDAGMVVGLLVGFALLALADRRRSLAPLLAALPCLWYAVAVRGNGVTAVLPFALFSGWLLARDHAPARLAGPFSPAWARLSVGIAVLAALVGTSLLATRAILGEQGRRIPLPQFLMAYDMAGISVRSGRNLMSPLYFPEQPLSLPELRRMYSPKTAFYLFWGQRPTRKLPMTGRPELIERVRDDWLAAIRAEPGAYLAHRSELFLAALGVAAGPPDQHQHIGLPRGRTFEYRGPNVFEWPHAKALVRLINQSRATLLYRPWPYLLIGVAGLTLAWRRPNRHRLEVTLLAASSVCYVAPLFLVGIASELRYMWWPILAAMLQLVLALGGRAAHPVTLR